MSDAGCIAAYPLPAYDINISTPARSSAKKAPAAKSPGKARSGTVPTLQQKTPPQKKIPARPLTYRKAEPSTILVRPLRRQMRQLPQPDFRAQCRPSSQKCDRPPAGTVQGFNASNAITDLNITWTRENLAEFITDPDAFAPGSAMGGLTLTKDEARLIADFIAADE